MTHRRHFRRAGCSRALCGTAIPILTKKFKEVTCERCLKIIDPKKNVDIASDK